MKMKNQTVTKFSRLIQILDLLEAVSVEFKALEKVVLIIQK